MERIARTYHAWRGEADAGAYKDVPGFCKSATIEEVKAHGYILTPGRYVGAADVEDEQSPFAERFAALRTKLEEQFAGSEHLTATIRSNLSGFHSDKSPTSARKRRLLIDSRLRK